MATVEQARPRPLNLTQVADAHGLLLAEVRTLVNEYRIPSYRLGNNRMIDPVHHARLRTIVRRYVKKKAKAEAEAAAMSGPAGTPGT